MKLNLLFLFFVLILNRSVFSNSISINGTNINFSDQEKNVVDLNKNWRFAIGDNLEWSKPQFNDRKWDTVYLPFTIEELIPFKYHGNVWLRSTFVIKQEFVSKSLSFIIKQFGASEIYIDGKLIHQFGKVGNSKAAEEAFNPQSIPVSFTIDSAGTHVIAIRYSNHNTISENELESELDAFDLQIVTAETGIYISELKILKENILTSVGIGIFLTLGIINFILFLFYKRDKSSLYYSLFSIAVASTFMVSAFEYTTNAASAEIVFDKLQTTFLFISNFFLVVLVYSFIYEKNPKRLWILLGLTVTGLSLVLIHFDFAKTLCDILNVYCIIEIVAIVLKAYFKKYDPTKKKRKIVRIILASVIALACLGLLINKAISLVIFIILVLIVVVPIAGLIFIVPLYLTIRHAKSFAVTNKSLEEQLIHVKELSAKTIEQEQEKKKLLESQNERLELMVTERTAELAEKSNEIKDSINYARRIQRAILTSKEEINETLKNYFILFKPKDIVSGDFYFYSKKEHTVLIAAADCTGHGVPGALMSMIGSEKLMSTVTESTSPSVILNLLNKGIKSSLRQSDHEESTKDGMDIALVSLDIETNKASYAGANRPIWIIRNGSTEFEEIKATKKAIGGFTSDDQHFAQHELKFNKGDTFYLFTDGYADQFGHSGKKLMTKKFREILIGIQNLPMSEQETYLNDFIENWKQDAEQIDDILVIGIRV
jgi:serine phosphatase RsbU (regulator of sigma subunit)